MEVEPVALHAVRSGAPWLMDKTYNADSVNHGGVSVCDAVNDEDAAGEATRDLQEQIKTSVTVQGE